MKSDADLSERKKIDKFWSCEKKWSNKKPKFAKTIYSHITIMKVILGWVPLAQKDVLIMILLLTDAPSPCLLS